MTMLTLASRGAGPHMSGWRTLFNPGARHGGFMLPGRDKRVKISPSPLPGPGERPRLPRVMLVDDDETMRILTRLVLKRSLQFEVVAEAKDGLEGILQAGICRPDLVILDIDMPLMGGLEALPGIIKASPNSRVVLFSGHELERSDAFFELGAAGFIGKKEEWPRVVAKLLSIVPTR